MGGEDSDLFDHFRMLVYAGFLCARKYVDEFVSLADMLIGNTRKQAIIDLRSRFKCELNEKELAKWVRQLVDESIDHWTTLRYEDYQRITNGIL